MVGEDIGGQVKSSMQWANGEVNAPNILSEPQRSDLSINQKNWSLRPPGAAVLPVAGLLIGLSLGQSIQLGLLSCSVIGGYGWLLLFKKFCINKHITFIVAIFLGLKTGASIYSYDSANIILYALVPWFLLLTFIISGRLRELKHSFREYLIIGIFLFMLGSFAWIKLSGLIVSGTIGACLFFMLSYRCATSERVKFLLAFGILGIFFWSPFLVLEKVNDSLTGITADQLYEGNDSDIQAPLFGKFWGDSTRGAWLLWSLVSAPGYSLPARDIAHGLRDFGMQFEQFTKWFDTYSINEHVLLCGIVGILFSIMLASELKRCWSALKTDHKITICCFLTLPFIGLGILASRYQWNYLLYHAHTSEFWLIFAIPTLLVYSSFQKLRPSSTILLGVIVALPLTTYLEKQINCFTAKAANLIGKTEKELGLSSSRFSAAIDIIEQDSNNTLDVLYFLPSGDMGDLTLRTKMRTLATHFAGDNFPKTSQLATAMPLNVYCAYDSFLTENDSFLKALDSKFPKKMSSEIIFSDQITVCKIQLAPKNKI